ncbi:MAG: hypothetical protein BMS9Abin34_360 [Patescibacteria group bacterium]|nr:MAG: hypothetical protein BMS9Abin34_360 [Patescibacteria group bacterium]
MVSHNVTRATTSTAFWTKALLYLPYFWYVGGVRFFARTFVRLIIYFNQATATTLMVRLIFVPLFGDYSLLGRVTAFPFRLFRILVGIVVILISVVGSLIFFLAWLGAPLWLFWRSPQLALVVFAVGGVVAFYTRLGKPHHLIESPWKDGFNVLDFMGDSDRSVIRKSKTPADLLGLAGRSRFGKEFLFRMGSPNLPPEKVVGLELSEIYKTAYDLAFKLGFKSVQTPHLLAALFKMAGERSKLAYQTLLWEKRRRGWVRSPLIWEEDYEVGPIGGVNRGWTGRVTPTLDAFSIDLTLEAAKGRLRLMIGKEKPLTEVARVLGRARKANVLLVGPPGSGKTSLVEGIAREVVRGSRFESLRGRRVIQLDVGAVAAGAESEGALGDRIQRIVKEIEISRGVVLVIDEIHNLILSGAGAETAFVFNSLRPHLETGKLQLIGATSWENYRKYLAPNEAFAQVFELVEVPEATKEESIEVLEYQTLELERTNRKAKVSFPAIEAAVEMSDRLIYERVLPDKALDILEEAVLAKQNADGGAVGEEEIAILIAEKTKVPVASLTQKEAKELLNLEEKIHKGLINQEEAVKSVSDALRRARAGLREEEKPIATFLFAGPTGVGKTELSKVLAEIYFGGREAMVRVDMSEFADLKNIYRLIGSPPGAGVQEPGQLTEAVRQRPFSLVLLDEFEKAHPQIWNLFLQVFDDGRLTGGEGETIDFTNTIIIATSNAGTRYIQDQIAAGRKVDDFRDEFVEQIREVFPPELLNRFDGVMVFKPLSRKHLGKIVRLKIKGLEEDLAVKNIKLRTTPEFIAKIAQLGYAPQWGARPLTRVIQDRVEAPLAKKILAGELKEGGVITLDLAFLTP